MKHIKRIEDWLSESSGLDRLIDLGLVDPTSLVRIVFNVRKAALGLLWQTIQDGKAQSVASKIEGLVFGDWVVMRPGDTLADHLMSRRPMGTLRMPGNLTVEDLVDSAGRMTREEFIEFCDGAYLDWFKTAVEEKGAFDSHGVQMIVSGLTGRALAVDLAKRVNESSIDRLFLLGLVDPEKSNRLEWVANRPVLVDAHSRMEAGQVPAREMGFPFFWVYGYDEAGTPTNSQAGTDVLGRDFLTGSDLSGLIGLDFENFLNRVESLFVEWLRTQPDEYFGKRFGFKSRPLFARDETSAILGFKDWTTIAESRDFNLNRLLSLGLVDPVSQPRVEYEVSNWFMNYMPNLVPDVSSALIWRHDVRSAIIGRVKIYEPGKTEVARWASLVGLDLFDGPKDIEQIRDMGLDRDGLRELAGELILEVIKRGFSTNWTVSSSPDPDPAGRIMPTLIKRADQSEWRPFSLNESKDENLMRLFKLGLVGSIAYLSYEINQQRLEDLQQEFLDPRASEPAFRKHLMYNVLTNSFAWWEHRLPEEAGKADPSLKLVPIVDGDYLLDEGAMSMRTLMDSDDPLDFDVPFEEFLQEIRSRILEHLRSSDIEYVERHMPLYILDKDTGFKYLFETGEPM